MHRIKKSFVALFVALAVVSTGSGCRSKIMGGPGVFSNKGKKEYDQAIVAFKDGDEAKGVALLQKVTVISPKHIGARTMLGDYFKDKGKYPEAVAEYEVLVVADPKSAEAHYKLALARQLNNDFENAILEYDRAIDIKSDYTDAKINRGTCLIHLNRIPDAISQLEEASKSASDSAVVFANLAVAYQAADKWPEAEAANRKALEIDPAMVSAQMNLATALLNQNKAAEAINLLKPIAEKTPTPENLKRLGDACAADKQREAAHAAYDQALQLNARYYPAMNGKASVLIDEYKASLRLDDLKRKTAVEMWLKSLEIEPEQPTVRDLAKLWENP